VITIKKQIFLKKNWRDGNNPNKRQKAPNGKRQRSQEQKRKAEAKKAFKKAARHSRMTLGQFAQPLKGKELRGW